MKKVLALVAVITLLIASYVYAQQQTPNPVVNSTNGVVQGTTGLSGAVPNKSVNYEGLDTSSIGAWGTTATGNPGFLVLKSCDTSNNCYPYYIWIRNGELYLASYATIAAYASFPTGNWSSTNMPMGTKVGGQ